MNWRILVVQISHWITRLGLGLLAGIFWGTTSAVCVTYLFNVPFNIALLYVALPVGVLIFLLLWSKLSQIAHDLESQ